jgi:hypothetical protein
MSSPWNETVEFAQAPAAKRMPFEEREGASHSLWINPNNGVSEAIPRHTEIKDGLARKICRRLEIPDPN